MNHNVSAGSNIDKLLRSAGIGGSASEKLQKAAGSNPAIAKAIDQLTDSDIAGITALLNDREAIARIMSTPKAQAVIKKLNG